MRWKEGQTTPPSRKLRYYQAPFRGASQEDVMLMTVHDDWMVSNSNGCKKWEPSEINRRKWEIVSFPCWPAQRFSHGFVSTNDEDFNHVFIFKKLTWNIVLPLFSSLKTSDIIYYPSRWIFAIQFLSATWPRIWLQWTNFFRPRFDTPHRLQCISKL